MKTIFEKMKTVISSKIFCIKNIKENMTFRVSSKAGGGDLVRRGRVARPPMLNRFVRGLVRLYLYKNGKS